MRHLTPYSVPAPSQLEHIFDGLALRPLAVLSATVIVKLKPIPAHKNLQRELEVSLYRHAGLYRLQKLNPYNPLPETSLVSSFIMHKSQRKQK
jgi:hypothetical protein